MNIDVFLCYRRHSAQTAKLFKRYLIRNHFNGEVWYSDDETYGDYNRDIPRLINNAECVVVFIDPDFTYNFLNDEDPKVDCITAKEIVEIIKKCQKDKNFRIVTVYVDRISGLSESESNKIGSLLKKEGIENPQEAVTLLSQRNLVFFSTATDDEDELFSTISKTMLPNEYYSNHKPLGDFWFGKKRTNADVIIWDSSKNLKPSNVIFQNTPIEFPLYNKIDRCRCNIDLEKQNNTMISLVETKVILSDETEEKNLFVRYQYIKYRLFYRTLKMWDRFELDREIAEFDWREDTYKIPNAMGLAFMVVTSDDKLIFTQRSKERHVRPGEYDCSIVEGLKTEGELPDGKKYDIDDENYLDYEIRRSFREEICAVDDGLDISVFGLVFDKSFGQWNIVGTIKTKLSSSEIEQLHAVRDDTYEKNTMQFVPLVDNSGKRTLEYLHESLKNYLREGMWSMALSALYAALIRVGFTDNQISDVTKDL